MAKATPDAVLDLILDNIATSTILHVCSGEPANYAGIAAVSLADVVMTAGDGNGDYTKGNGDTNGAGKIKCETTNGKKMRRSYTSRGEPYRVWGDVPYPEERIYNAYGDLTELHTYREGGLWEGSTWPASTGPTNMTMWKYDGPSGMLTSKVDHAGERVQDGGHRLLHGSGERLHHGVAGGYVSGPRRWMVGTLDRTSMAGCERGRETGVCLDRAVLHGGVVRRSVLFAATV